ncbi:MAG: crotonase/enoyl-CoA hydratase family protein [Solirubrobacterales bacterium]
MTRTSFDSADGIATITMDDGKVNALSPEMLAEVAAQFERAEADGAVVVLTGRAQTLSAGFDVRCEQERWPDMVAAGAALAERIMSFPGPVVAACNGNAIAMGAFLLLSADYRLGARGDFRIGLNEVAIGLTIPWFGIEIARHRLTRPYFDRCTITGAVLGPEEAKTAGFLDEVVEPDRLMPAAEEAARALAALDRGAHKATKLRVRETALAGVRDGIDRIKGGEREW